MIGKASVESCIWYLLCGTSQSALCLRCWLAASRGQCVFIHIFTNLLGACADGRLFSYAHINIFRLIRNADHILFSCVSIVCLQAQRHYLTFQIEDEKSAKPMAMYSSWIRAVTIRGRLGPKSCSILIKTEDNIFTERLISIQNIFSLQRELIWFD